jgi:hypothetical protein
MFKNSSFDVCPIYFDICRITIIYSLWGFFFTYPNGVRRRSRKMLRKIKIKTVVLWGIIALIATSIPFLVSATS